MTLDEQVEKLGASIETLIEQRDAAIARAEAAEARAGALSRALAAVRINAEDKLLAEVAHLHSAYDTERAAREKAERDLAAARELLRDIAKYATEDRAVTPGYTRLARALARVAKALSKESGT